jgi:hypothetical protein
MSSHRKLVLLAAAAAGASLGSLPSPAGAAQLLPTISVNFGSDDAFSGLGSAALNPTDVTGVVPTANWNNAPGANGSLSNLVQDLNGTATPTTASVSWTSSGIWNTDQEDNTSQFVNPADEAMMKGYIDTFVGAPSSVNFTGLANGPYNVYVYSLTAVNNRDSGNITVGGVREKSTSIPSTVFQEGGGPGGALDQGGLPGNYNLYPGVAVTDGNLSILLTAETFRTAINGVELVLIPEPAGVGVLGVGLVGLLARHRRRA